MAKSATVMRCKEPKGAVGYYHDDVLIGRPEGERVTDFGPRRHVYHFGPREALATHHSLHPPVAAGVIELHQASRMRGSRSLFST